MHHPARLPGCDEAIVVDADCYLQELVRYTQLNPVRAALVTDPLDYPWSGHRAYLGQELLPRLTTDWVLSMFAQQAGLARDRYRQFVIDGAGDGHREEFHGGGSDSRVLGDDTFIEQTLEKSALSSTNPLPTLDEIEQRVCVACGAEPSELASPGRGAKLAQARGMISWLATR